MNMELYNRILSILKILTIQWFLGHSERVRVEPPSRVLLAKLLNSSSNLALNLKA